MKNKILLELKKNFPKLKNNNSNIATSKLKNIEGWDSLSSINFILKIEKKYKIKVKVDDIGKLKTINDLVLLFNK